jgi:beta-amylase
MLRRLFHSRKAPKNSLGVLLLALSLSQVSPVQAKTDTFVMAPLGEIRDWNAFRAQLRTLKEAGVVGITTDVWWGHFEQRGDNIFDWRYYQFYAQVVAEIGLQWVPILSFHQCGGNVDDDCNIPLPSWVWDLGREDEMKFIDENGFINGEYVSHFFEPIYGQYAEAMHSFAENFRQFSGLIPKIYLSLGPAGELRYPSYYSAAGWSYPSRGRLQAYSPAAIRDFRNAMRRNYGSSIDALNSAWGTQLQSFNEISPPRDGDRFFINGFKTIYGRDFLTWYQGRLIGHLQTMAFLARETISTQMPSTRIGAKIAGIHWLYNSPQMPHAAEYAAGYYNYSDILRAMKALDVDLTFTCLEMDDFNKWQAPYYSAPKTLVEQVSSIARSLGLNVNGENALAIRNNPSRYDNIADILGRFMYQSFTLLRLQNVVGPRGEATGELPLLRDKIIKPFTLNEI